MVREQDFVDEYYADKDLSLLKKLTLVIPTYNRNYYLSRCLWYHAHFPFGQIIVADSSPEEKKMVNRETVAKVREMFGVDVLYLEYEPETEKYGGDIYRKWGDAVQHVETEYSQIVTDKEFLIPTHQSHILSALELHPNYIGSIGKTSLVQRLSSEKYYLIKYLSPCKICHTPYVGICNIDRFISASLKGEGNSSLLMSIHRSSVHKEVYLSYLESEIYDLQFGERYLSHLGYLYGPVIHFSEYYQTIRDTSNLLLSNGQTNVAESSASRYDYTNLDNFTDRRSKYTVALKNLLSQMVCCNEDTASKVCEFLEIKEGNRTMIHLNPITIYRNIIVRIFSDNISSYLKYTYRFITKNIEKLMNQTLYFSVLN